MNREQRRQQQKNLHKVPSEIKGQMKTPEKLNEFGEDFIKFAEEQNVNLNAFFKMFSAWIRLSAGQKDAVIVECVRQGKIDLEEDISGKQSGESK